MREGLQTFMGLIVALVFFGAVVLLVAAFIQGGAWLSATLYPWLVSLSGITLAITVFVLLPNAIFSSVPKFAGNGMLIASYVFGATLWVWSFLLTYLLWGGIGLAIGLFMAGMGVVPLAMIATLFKGMWSELGQLVALLALTFGVRTWGGYLLSKASKNDSAAASL